MSDPRRDAAAPDNAATIAAQAAEIASLESAVEDFTLQATRDLEELTWFREMTSQLEHFEIDRDFADVAGPLLPALRELLQAHTVAVVLDANADGGGVIDPEIVSIVGDDVPEPTVLRLVGACHAEARGRVVVLNGAAEMKGRGVPPDLGACLVAAMAKQPGQYGWIVAIGKTAENEASLENCERGVSRAEFGTVEATLLASAARTFGTHCRNVRLFRERKELVVGIVRAMINALDAKDSYTCGHSDRVALIGRLIADEMALPAFDREAIYLSGLLHDVGKIAIPDSVLLKPGRLTDEEFEIIKKHPVTGYRMLCHLEKLKPILPGVLHHHEAWDGSGYPDGLVGTDIPRMARIMAVADAWDAMTSRRPYRDAMPLEKAESILRNGRGEQWDPHAIDAFFARIEDVKAISATDGAHANVVLGDGEPVGTDFAIDSAVATAAFDLL